MRYSLLLSSIRLFEYYGAMVTQFDVELEQIDIKTIFLHGELEEKIYMKQPEGYIQEGQENKAYILTKSLYELKQSFRQ